MFIDFFFVCGAGHGTQYLTDARQASALEPLPQPPDFLSSRNSTSRTPDPPVGIAISMLLLIPPGL